MSFLFRKTSIPPSASFRITQQGTEKLQDFKGDPKSRILVALESHGSSNINEIALASSLSRGQVERLIPALIGSGYVQYTGHAQGGDEA